jgi:2,5-diamino-6-(ribosylamino)-4(3H)-pyrimidinone 5'-phosphate reductase
MARRSEKLFIATTNKDHPAFKLKEQFKNIVVIYYKDVVDFADLFSKLYTDYGAKRMTIQSGGELNAVLLRAGLIDNVLIVVAPCLVGGRTTTTLVEGDSLHTVEDLTKIRPLKLKSCTALEDSYVRLDYEVVN